MHGYKWHTYNTDIYCMHMHNTFDAVAGKRNLNHVFLRLFWESRGNSRNCTWYMIHSKASFLPATPIGICGYTHTLGVTYNKANLPTAAKLIVQNISTDNRNAPNSTVVRFPCLRQCPVLWASKRNTNKPKCWLSNLQTWLDAEFFWRRGAGKGQVPGACWD